MKNTKSIACITSLVILGIATTAISSALQKRPAGPPSRVLQKQTELLINGNYAKGTKPWVLEEAASAKGTMGATKEGPGGQATLKVSIQNKGEQSWQVQLHQGGLKIEKGRKYILTYWAKADRPTVVTVNCMQNHEPWEHHGAATEVNLSTKWEKRTFSFAGPWDDTNARITFTNLATQPGATYWFSNVSLLAGPKTTATAKKPPVAVATKPAQPTRVVVWDGETAKNFGAWANPPTSSYEPKTGEAHSGNTALEFKFNDQNVWIGCGFHWFDWKKGTNVGTDVRSMTHLTFWIKAVGSTGDLDAQLLCNGEVLDTPEHHTSKARVALYCPTYRDGQWHEVAIPLADLAQPEGFDPKIVSQLDLGINPSGKVSGSFLIDDIAFENRGTASEGLRVVGNQLRDSSGNVVRLQGVNVPSLDWSPVGEHVMESIDVAIDKWNSNIVRIPLTQDLWFGYEKGKQSADRGESYRKIVDSIVKRVAEKNCYVLLDLHWSDAGQWGQNVGQHKMPDSNSVAFWKDFAKRYANHPSVLFDLYNEPHSVSWDVWKNGGQVEDQSKGISYRSPGMQAILDTVRSTGAKNIVIAGGLDWGYDLSGIMNGYALSDKIGNGIVYGSHIYPWKKDWDKHVTPVVAMHPVFVGEVGTKPWEEGHPPHENVYTTSWAPEVMAYIEKHQMNWTAWSFHPTANPCIITGWDYMPTAYWGKYVKEALSTRVQSGPEGETFVWRGDCSAESSFVNSNHPLIPGHYGYESDPDQPKRGIVFAGRLTPDFKVDDPESVHLHPDIYFDRFRPGNHAVQFDVKVADLEPAELGPYRTAPWLNLVTIFDETVPSGGSKWKPSVMCNLVGSPGKYRIQTFSLNEKGEGTFFEIPENAPTFPLGKWVQVRVEADVKQRQVRVFLNGALTSSGPYGGKAGIAGAHMGLYTNRLMKRATLFNDAIEIKVGPSALTVSSDK
jgi:hypothetical protein